MELGLSVSLKPKCLLAKHSNAMPIAPAPKEGTSLGLTRVRSHSVVGRLINTGRIELTNEGGGDATALLVYCFAAAFCVKNCRNGGGRGRRRGRPGAERAGARIRLQADGGNEEEDSGNDWPLLILQRGTGRDNATATKSCKFDTFSSSYLF